MSNAQAKYNETLYELAALVAASLMDDGLTPEAADAAAWRAVDRVRKSQFGGQKVYIAKTKYATEYMRAEIRRRWDTRNTRELCIEFEISESRLRQLFDEARAIETEQRQLFRAV